MSSIDNSYNALIVAWGRCAIDITFVVNEKGLRDRCYARMEAILIVFLRLSDAERLGSVAMLWLSLQDENTAGYTIRVLKSQACSQLILS
jgi:hypothetical protein